jgi:hypothetical protein
MIFSRPADLALPAHPTNSVARSRECDRSLSLATSGTDSSAIRGQFAATVDSARLEGELSSPARLGNRQDLKHKIIAVVSSCHGSLLYGLPYSRK